MSIGDLLEELDRESEAVQVKMQADQGLVAKYPRAESRSVFAKPLMPNASEFKQKDSYALEDLLRFDGETFIGNAYRAILRREPDENGMRLYLEKMKAGMHKARILEALAGSQEGKTTGIRVQGLRFHLLGLALMERRVLGSPLRFVVRLFGSLQRLSGEAFVLRREVAQVAEAQRANYERLVNGSTKQFGDLLDMLAVNASAIDHLRGDLEKVRVAQTELSVDQAEVRGLFNADQRARKKLLDVLGGEISEKLSEGSTPADIVAAQNDRFDNFYRAFENRCRGSELEVKAGLSVYLPYIDNALENVGARPDPAVIDIGCGRGEWLDLLQEKAVTVVGVDINGSMIDGCRDKGLRVERGDALTYLQGLPAASVAAVTGFHIIEHLSFELLFAVFDEAYRVLKPGGLIIFETPNPENILVGSHNFYHDPSHRNPVTPIFAEFVAGFFGYTAVEVLRLHPCPETTRVAGSDPLTNRLNDYLYGAQDYAVIAVKPGSGE